MAPLVVLALIRTLKEFVGAPLSSLIFLLVACSLNLVFYPLGRTQSD